MNVFDLGITESEIASAIEPFVKERFKPGDPAWTKLAVTNAKLQRRKRLMRRLLDWFPGMKRDQASIEFNYDKQWAGRPFELQLDANGPTVPCVWQGAGMYARAIATKRVHMLFLLRAIARLKPASVLEVGCGNGLNLFILAGRFPDVRFTGIELTAGGVAAAEAVRALPELPETIQTFSPEPLADAKPFDRIRIVRGTAAAMPFHDGEFDLVFTSLALEQMEQIRWKALAEIRRVACKHTAMVEPFFDWNATGPRRDYIVANDYFSGKISDLPRFGLTPIFTTADMPCKLINRPGLVICNVRKRAEAHEETTSLMNRVSAYIRYRRGQVERSYILHPIRNRRIAAARRAAEAYFRSDPELLKLLSIIEHSNSTGAGLTDYHLLHRYVMTHRPNRILEFGSGKTTVIMAHALAMVNRGSPGCVAGCLYSLEDIARFHENTKSIMPPDLRPYVTLIHSPKRESYWRDEIWGFGYSELPPGPFDFVFVDGPTEYRDDEAMRQGVKGACLDLLYLLQRDSGNRIDVVVDQKFSSLDAYQSVLPSGTVCYDPVMDVGVMSGINGQMLCERHTNVRLKRESSLEILRLV